MKWSQSRQTNALVGVVGLGVTTAGESMAGIRRNSAASQHTRHLVVNEAMKLVMNHFKLYFVIPETRADAWRTMACQWDEMARLCRLQANLLADRDREEVQDTDDE